MKALSLLIAAALTFGLGDVRAETREFTYDVETAVDASGKVTQADVLADIDPAFESAVVGLMKQWQFKPATKDGAPVPAKTWMTVQVVADIAPGQSANLVARYVRHGNLQKARMAPLYPAAAMQRRSEAEVIVDVEIDATGKPTAVTPYSVRVTGGDKELGRLFSRSAIDAISQWRFDPEMIDGQPLASRRLVPITYTIQPPPSRGPLRATLKPADAAQDAAIRAALADIDVREQRSAAVGNATGLTLVSDGQQG